jgi:hypothetical protein
MIYFLKSKKTNFLKIGTSTNISNRVKSLDAANPMDLKIEAVLQGSFQTESGLHDLFSHLNRKGEWFKINDEMKYFIRAIRLNPEENNIYTLYRISQRLRITDKANRLSKRGNKKLLEKINKINARHRSQ